MAVYWEHVGLGSDGQKSLIFVAWPDGRVVWSGDRLRGGPPYREGQADPKRVTALLGRFEKDGLFDDPKLKHLNVGIDAPSITIFVKSGKRQVEMASWHELKEESGNVVDDGRGLKEVRGGSRFGALREAPRDFLFYRFVWSETRGRLADLTPPESAPTDGQPVTGRGFVLTWHEGAAPTKGKGGGGVPAK